VFSSAVGPGFGFASVPVSVSPFSVCPPLDRILLRFFFLLWSTKKPSFVLDSVTKFLP
jgi:hypothetical protein